jgi:cobalt-zinc-cadmium efflux system membrane fusion protein
MNKNELRTRFTTTLSIALYAMLLSACSKAPEPVPADEPVIAGTTVSFPANSPTARRLLTTPVVAAQENVLSLPARIVWDEDHTSRIVSPVAGRLDEIMVQPGSPIKAGQPLAYLNSPDLGSAQTEAARAEAELAQYERAVVRANELFAVSGIAAKEVEQAQLDLARARAEAERTRLRLKSLGAANGVDQHYVLRSQIAGVVVERNTNPGMEWRPDQPGAPLFVVSDPTFLWCWIDAPERTLNMLRPGMKVVLRSSAWPQDTFKAEIDHIGDALDATSRTIKVRARLRNPERHLKGEMFVTAELTSKARGALDVPAKAVFLNNEQQQVFIKTAEGQFSRKTIVPVAANEDWVSIAQGLNKGDEVVVDGALYLEKLVEESSAQSGANAASQSASTDKPSK